MSSLSGIIDFLLGLMRDDKANAAFEQNPQAALTGSGLGGVTGQDIRDARMVMRDEGGLRPSGGGNSHSGSDDPVREIRHTTKNYEVDNHYQHTEQTFNLINIDDRDTTVVDSFNSNDNNTTDVVAIQDNDEITNIQDSFNDVTAPPQATNGQPEGNSSPVDVPPKEIPEEPEASVDPVPDEAIEEPPVDDVSEPEPEPEPEPVEAAII
jgi:hypothetical protein